MQRRGLLSLLTTSTLGAIALSVTGCSKPLRCDDTASLSPAELETRNVTAQYVDQSPEAEKHCSSCALFQSKGDTVCGGCQLVKGPINPNGYCKLWVAKRA